MKQYEQAYTGLFPQTFNKNLNNRNKLLPLKFNKMNKFLIKKLKEAPDFLFCTFVDTYGRKVALCKQKKVPGLGKLIRRFQSLDETRCGGEGGWRRKWENLKSFKFIRKKFDQNQESFL